MHVQPVNSNREHRRVWNERLGQGLMSGSGGLQLPMDSLWAPLQTHVCEKHGALYYFTSCSQVKLWWLFNSWILQERNGNPWLLLVLNLKELPVPMSEFI